MFPEFRGRDLAALIGDVVVEHRAQDGATIDGLPLQIAGAGVPASATVLLTIGGNDVLQGMMSTSDAWLDRFATGLQRAVTQLGHAGLFIANVYDPSFGDDRNNPLDLDPARARRLHTKVNALLAAEAARVGAVLVDLHAHFLTGGADWFTQVIEPSLTGASEVRRAFLTAWEAKHASE